MEPESALITKLHTKLSLFRRDRDDALRRRDLSVERARIVRKDCEHAASEVKIMQTKLAEIREKTKRKIDEIDGVKKEVDALTMEYKFQHSELNAKREKLSHLDAKRSVESSSRSSTTNSSRETLRKRREHSSLLNAPQLSFEEKKRQLEVLLNGDEEWILSLPEWIERRVKRVWEEDEDVRRGCLMLERKIKGYRDALEELDTPSHAH